MGSPLLTSSRRAGRQKDEFCEDGRHPEGLQAEPHGAGTWAEHSKKPIWWSREVVEYDPTLGDFLPLEQYRGDLRDEQQLGTFQLEQQQCGETRARDNILLTSEARKVRHGGGEASQCGENLQGICF